MIRNLKCIGGMSVLAIAVACGGKENSADQVALATTTGAPADTVVVYKTPTCGCCANWVDHVAENGFAVVTHDMDDLSQVKQQLGVPVGRVSCHTATVNGYTIEGHVPADLIRRLLDEKPAGVRGLAVPGMPIGSPGMEGVISQRYDVLAFDDAGNVEVFASR